ncbi:polymeric immunoglobulin receptor isoform X2 [Meriones unguiculatus]|uniref:polymeric immunoglobulin receptor isoform X2 n=1 Tax=Meriones unguiculatus TaxID=10047 RepID=UPI00293E0085|nr:polymeric immunoglobulin receptor isoform X2 [Meriones unguiculatus]
MAQPPWKPTEMRLFLFTILLAVFPVVSTKSPIFGPQDVSSMEGNSVSITCYYPDTSVNRHTRKYWCRQGPSGYCTTLISSNGYTSKEYSGRAKLINFPENSTFVINIAQLTLDDTGSYKCGLGTTNRGLFFDISLEVSQAPELPGDTHVYTKEVGRNVTIDCPFKQPNPSKKSLCKKIGQACELVIDSTGNVNTNYKDRAKLFMKGTSQVIFSVSISHLRHSDAGLYVCQAGEDSSADKKNVDLQVLEPEPELVYKDLRSSVTFECALGREVASENKYLCRKNKEACDVVINTLGKRDPAFEGRILITQMDDNGRFSVLITGLRKEDAGQYLCGAHSSGLPREGWPVQAWQLFVNEATRKPDLEVTPQDVTATLGETLTLSCHYPCKFYSHEKYWCKWSNKGCHILPIDDEAARQPSVSCDKSSQLISMTLNPVKKEDEGWYWCGVKQGQAYGETTAIYVAVEERTEGSRNVSPTDANARAKVGPEEEVIEPRVNENENKAILNPRLSAEERGVENVGDQAPENRASVDAGSADGQKGSSKVLFSTLVPLGLVLAVGALAVWVARVRHRKNVDRMSISSYRTDISMADFRNSRDFGGNDNKGISPDTQETVLEGKNEIVTTTETATEPEESKKAKRSSKEEADLAYSAFLLQSSNIVAQVHNGPKDA